ncbi:hypothetical protein CRUP_023843 [Coryphaenoides rupestris]|nr:hypothetical protein CRUP_023843 [Coryphaenoides rupestris]
MSTEEATRQRLKAAVHYTTGQMCQDIGGDHGREFDRQVVAAIAETTFRQHAKRSTVTSDDVMLLARRSTALLNFIQRKNEELSKDQKHVKKNAGKKTSKDQEDSN